MFKPIIHNMKESDNPELFRAIQRFNSKIDYKTRLTHIVPLSRKIKVHQLAKEELERLQQDVTYLLKEHSKKSYLNAYLETIENPMQRGKTRKTLETTQGFSGEYMPRYEYAQKCALEGGYYIKNNRFYKPNECFYEVKDVTKAFVDYFTWCLNVLQIFSK